mmetsp:Transcript_7903/g.20423  ORF Transcript_7903/g.20423 Transcript_7903/m.20423 type:complete len:228 (+) Transcript_7903:509-1192(+)
MVGQPFASKVWRMFRSGLPTRETACRDSQKPSSGGSEGPISLFASSSVLRRGSAVGSHGGTSLTLFSSMSKTLRPLPAAMARSSSVMMRFCRRRSSLSAGHAASSSPGTTVNALPPRSRCLSASRLPGCSAQAQEPGGSAADSWLKLRSSSCKLGKPRTSRGSKSTGPPPRALRAARKMRRSAPRSGSGLAVPGRPHAAARAAAESLLPVTLSTWRPGGSSGSAARP